MPTTIKDLVRLDPASVQLWDGSKWNRVISWEKSPRTGDELEIEFRNGARVGCTRNHRWPTDRGIVEASNLRIGDVVPTCRLPEPESPRQPAALPPLDIGWFVGLYLAEGSQSDGTIQISGHVKEVERFERLCQIAEDYDGYCFKANTGGNQQTININSPILLGIVDAYVSGRVAGDKHLNPRCWKRDNLFLSSVMAGYLSGDGSKQNDDRWKLGFCNNDQLAADLRTLGARLGFSVRLRRRTYTLNGQPFPGWGGSVVFRPEKRHRPDGEIVAIGASRARMFWDIALESEPHLFALASGILTHNSNPMPESVEDRPTKAHEYLFMMAKSERYFYDACAIAEPALQPIGVPMPTGQRKRATAERGSGSYQTDLRSSNLGSNQGSSRRNRRTVWSIATQPLKMAHFAVMPSALVEPCILAGTSARGCCPACGAPWGRVVERATHPRSGEVLPSGRDGGLTPQDGLERTGLSHFRYNEWLKANPPQTVGWEPSCSCLRGEGWYWCPDCDVTRPIGELTSGCPRCGETMVPAPHEPIPATVLDPFVGAGTVPLVAEALGRRGIGVDVSAKYLRMARRRINRPHAPPEPTAPTSRDRPTPLFDGLD